MVYKMPKMKPATLRNLYRSRLSQLDHEIKELQAEYSEVSHALSLVEGKPSNGHALPPKRRARNEVDRAINAFFDAHPQVELPVNELARTLNYPMRAINRALTRLQTVRVAPGGIVQRTQMAMVGVGNQ